MLPQAGATELIFLAALALIVVGPKDLPVLMRRVGQWIAKMRSLAAEFRSSFDELARQSELDELRKEVDALRNQRLPDPLEDVSSSLQQVGADVQSSLSDATPAYAAPAEESAWADPYPDPAYESAYIRSRRPPRRGGARAALGPAPGLVTPKRKLIAVALARPPVSKPRPRRVSAEAKA